MTVLILAEINPYAADGPVNCDCCSETVLTDMYHNWPDRLFYRIENEDLNVCENCLPELE
jgi:hypothetical protein